MTHEQWINNMEYRYRRVSYPYFWDNIKTPREYIILVHANSMERLEFFYYLAVN